VYQKSNAHELAEKYGYLPYMVERYIQFLGLEDTIKLLEANERPLKPTIRVNTLKISPAELKEKLEKKGISLKSLKWLDYGFSVESSELNIGSTHEYLQGYYYIQNEASMLPAHILSPKETDLVIDMCAAPGSKSTQLAQIMNNKGQLLLIDRNINRIPSLNMNIRRMGILNSIILNFDALDILKLNLKADKILLDAPCTGEGLIIQDKNRKKSKKYSDIQKISKLQIKILKAGLTSLKSGGLLMYSTCSIAPEENEMVVNKVLNGNPNYSIIDISIQYGVKGLKNAFGTDFQDSMGKSQRLYPYLHDTIGFFVCLITKE